MGDVLHVTPPADDVPELKGDLVHKMHDPHDVHSVIASAVAPFRLVPIHPFVGGKGRASRLLSMLDIYRAGYDVTRLVAISESGVRDRTNPSNAIQRVRRTQLDMTQWIEFFTRGLATQLTERSKATSGRSISSIAGRGWRGTSDHIWPASMSPSVQRPHHGTVRGSAWLPSHRALDAAGAFPPIVDGACRLE